jgi:addiction module HigA family antidote
MMNKKIPIPTIGEIIRDEFLEPLSITAYRMAKDLNVSTSTILDILNDKRKLSTEMALKLAKYFGTSDKFWINIQSDIEIRNKKDEMKKELQKIHPVSKTA